ncbi:MAG: SH3 domain-containing protein [Pyrinomonadaceae bacterium]
MKKCPQCSSVYADDTEYCLNDGQILISEVFPLPSEASPDDEEITLIRTEPIVVDLSPTNAPTLEYRTPPQNVQAKAKTGSKNYLVFLIIGLFLGGGLVLATLFLAKNFYRNNDANNMKSSTTNTNQPSDNSQPKNTNSQVNKQVTASAKHQEKTDVSDEEFNGRVITLNAYIRSSPSRSSSEIDVLPVDDRLTITARDDENSPWYHVVCEHGVSGWMHGNTIEFTR